MVVIKAKDRFAELPEKEKQAIRKRADEIYAEVTGGTSTHFCVARKAAPRRQKPQKKTAK
jgi:hypothetical protein